MGRFILRYEGKGAKPQHDVQRLLNLSGVKLVDESAKMLLVEAPVAEHLQAAVEAADGWSIAAEHSVKLPPTHPNLSKSRTKLPG